jgi:ABC-type bacteriocin/lantibiotic exporter with double-glycine peptidase domain
MKLVSMQRGRRRVDVCARQAPISAVFLMIMLTVPFLYSPQVYALPESNMLAVPYHTQETDYYCGPTSVQMVLEYITGEVTAQGVLAEEMGTSAAKKGTDTNMMPIPFRNREYASSERRKASLNDLKELNAKGYATIMNIHFDTDHKSGHYVVVVGYNETGIFMNDPWPTRWKQPVSRRTGSSTYLSYSLVIDLWMRREYWMIEIPYKPST